MRYFAGANTYGGFVSLFDKAIKGVENVCILKGTSGCGKSTFMRKIGEEAERRGYECDYILCSADPSSLDGVIVKEMSLAVVDGTPPHAMEPKYPLAKETLVDLSAFINENKVKSRREEVISLIDKKREKYSSAYNLLAACKEAEYALSSLEERYFDRDLSAKKALSLVRNLSFFGGEEKEILAYAFNSEGIFVIKTFEEAENAYILKGSQVFKKLFMRDVVFAAHELGASFTKIPDPLDLSSPAAVYFKDTSSLVCAYPEIPAENVKKIRSINVNNLASPDVKNIKLRENSIKKLYSELLSSAKDELEIAKEYHSMLEKIYISAADFDALSSFTENYIKKLFRE